MEEKQLTLPQPPLRGGDTTLPAAPTAGGTALAAPPSNNEEAGRFFAEKIGRLPGVVRVERWGAEGPGAPAFHVYLRPDDRETEYAVYEAKGQVYDRYPDAYLEVVVLEAIDVPLTNGESSA